MFLKQLSLLGEIIAKHLRTYSTKITVTIPYILWLCIFSNLFHIHHCSEFFQELHEAIKIRITVPIFQIKTLRSK